jgi:diaminopimelate epimerase
MMLGVPFWKYSATGNDFIILNNQDGLLKLSDDQAVAMCKRRTGIGADGVLILESSTEHDFKLSIINADGSHAEMCGNGARAIVHYAHYMLKLKPSTQYSFETLNGVYHATIDQDFVSLQMTEVYDEDAVDLPVLDDAKQSFYINTGVPHAVYHVEDVDTLDVFNIGKKIRNEVTHNNGCNVNFFSVIDEASKVFQLRTYERGVEDETLCCGTGTTATAISILRNFDFEGEMTFQVKGGEVSVSLDKDLKTIIFKGKVTPIYRGEVF